jgi:hypothetical protein
LLAGAAIDRCAVLRVRDVAVCETYLGQTPDTGALWLRAI